MNASNVRLCLYERALRAALLVIATACSGCGGPTAPSEAGLPLPRDPGTVLAHVREETGAPVRGVGVQVEIPNTLGSVYWVGVSTEFDGSARISAVPAGLRRVEIAVPASYRAVTAIVQDVVVTKDAITEVSFVLTRVQSP